MALTDAQIVEYLQEFPDWERDGDMLSKTFKADTYMAGLALAAAIGTTCDVLDHHPDLFIGWKKVTVKFTTHDAGNKITEKDFQAVKKIENLGYSRP